MKLALLVLLVVLINSVTYILVLPRFFDGRATYFPFVVSTISAVVFAVLFAWGSLEDTRNLLTRTILCLSSAIMVGGTVVLISLLIIVNTLGS